MVSVLVMEGKSNYFTAPSEGSTFQISSKEMPGIFFVLVAPVLNLNHFPYNVCRIAYVIDCLVSTSPF
jgi:hypothetical protein